jgi:hypothetical protein
MPPRDEIDDNTDVESLRVEDDVGTVVLTRETELLREIARALAREAAREAFERALAAQNGPAGEESR